MVDECLDVLDCSLSLFNVIDLISGVVGREKVVHLGGTYGLFI